MPKWRNGRRSRLKIYRASVREGSSPSFGTSMTQKTIKKRFSLEGQGIHSGISSKLNFSPLPQDSGILFIRKTGNKTVTIPATWKYTGNLVRSTGLVKSGVEVNTVEHLMAALYMMEITNISIEMTNSEVPIMDGGAMAFIKALKKAGIKDQKKEVVRLGSRKPFILHNGNSFISYVPSEKDQLTCIIDFPHPLLKNRALHVDLNSHTLIKEIANARTFGFEAEIKALQKAGLGKGGNLHNTVLLTKEGIKNKSLHMADECLRHKALDFIGDMYLSGKFLQGHFLVCRSGHKLDLEFLKKFDVR